MHLHTSLEKTQPKCALIKMNHVTLYRHLDLSSIFVVIAAVCQYFLVNVHSRGQDSPPYSEVDDFRLIITVYFSKVANPLSQHHLPETNNKTFNIWYMFKKHCVGLGLI